MATGGDFGAVCDDFYVVTRLFLKLDLEPHRETVLHFFDRIRKAFPPMTRFRRREEGELLLDEDAGEGVSRRWVGLDRNSLRFGHFAPPGSSSLCELAETILEQAPHHLSLNSLDYDRLETTYGFDLQYRGNHDRLIAETLWADHPIAEFLFGEDAVHPIDAQPCLGIALTEGCDVQAYLDVKSQSTTFEVRTGEYEEQPIGVCLTLRKYFGGRADTSLLDAHRTLFDRCEELASDKVVPILVTPLAQRIARGC